jgi:hypothetical protein
MYCSTTVQHAQAQREAIVTVTGNRVFPSGSGKPVLLLPENTPHYRREGQNLAVRAGFDRCMRFPAFDVVSVAPPALHSEQLLTSHSRACVNRKSAQYQLCAAHHGNPGGTGADGLCESSGDVRHAGIVRVHGFSAVSNSAVQHRMFHIACEEMHHRSDIDVYGGAQGREAFFRALVD